MISFQSMKAYQVTEVDDEKLSPIHVDLSGESHEADGRHEAGHQREGHRKDGHVLVGQQILFTENKNQ